MLIGRVADFLLNKADYKLIEKDYEFLNHANYILNP